MLPIEKGLSSIWQMGALRAILHLKLGGTKGKITKSNLESESYLGTNRNDVGT